MGTLDGVEGDWCDCSGRGVRRQVRVLYVTALLRSFISVCFHDFTIIKTLRDEEKESLAVVTNTTSKI